jgi:hypothetical protein
MGRSGGAVVGQPLQLMSESRVCLSHPQYWADYAERAAAASVVLVAVRKSTTS